MHRFLLHCSILCFMLLACSGLYSQASSLARTDISVGAGLTMQFAKVVNEGMSVGPHVHAAFAWRVKEHSGLSLLLGYDYMRSTFGSLRDSLDAEAQFLSVGLRAETHSDRASFNPYFCLGLGYGTTHMVVPDPQAEPSLRNTAVMFGVGFTMNVWDHCALEPLVRFMISEGAAVSIPLTLSLRADL